MSELLLAAPYGPRDDEALLNELNVLSQHHLAGCPEYRSIWPDWDGASRLSELPWLHVGVFKHINFKTQAEGIHHERTLKSSATSSGVPSKINLDRVSSERQSSSTLSILKDCVGDEIRPLLILDSIKSLRVRGELSARIAAALSLKPLANEFHFLLDDAADATSLKWELVSDLLDRFDDLLVYGFTWILWLAWGDAAIPQEVRDKLHGKRLHFIHSGGWKKLEALSVGRSQFDQSLLDGLHPESRVIDYYGLVEQVGVIYPLCEHGYRHVPVWAHIIIRDPYSLEPVEREEGQIQLMNTLAQGAPYHNVLTEDVGRIEPGPCACGRSGPRFELLGRVPKAEVRGCANA